jgi:hypothetical protein
MSSKKVYFLMMGVLVLISIGGVASIFMGTSLLKDKAAELTAMKLESQVLEEQQRSLTQAKRDIEQYAEIENIAKAVVPQDKDQARTVREMVKIAGDSGISISAISFPSSNLGTEQKTNTRNAEGETTAEPEAPLQSQVDPVKGISGLYQMEVTLQTDTNRSVTYNSLIGFLQRLEQNRRTAQVSQLNITPDTDNIDRLNFTVGINVFIKP